MLQNILKQNVDIQLLYIDLITPIRLRHENLGRNIMQEICRNFILTDKKYPNYAVYFTFVSICLFASIPFHTEYYSGLRLNT